MNILHLVMDEKFIGFFAGVANKIPNSSHRFVVHTTEPDKPLRHVSRDLPFRIVDNSYFTSTTMREDLADCDALLVHFMTPMGVHMIKQAPSHVIVAWSGWGADYYHLLSGGQKALFGPYTQQLATRMNIDRAKQHPIAFVRWLLRPLTQACIRHTKWLPAIKRVQLFSSPLPTDYDLLKSSLGRNFTAKYCQINYGSVEQTFAAGNCGLYGSDILVGNSACLDNNHIEAFCQLAKQDLSGRKVVVPLSYGDPVYRELILEYGVKILGGHFYPIIDFIPLAEYNDRISRCSVAIMNHRRQQALGNIGALLYRGAKLFLDERNITYIFLKQRGAHIFSTSLLDNNYNELFNPLLDKQKKDNLLVLQAFWGHDVVSRNMLKFVSKLREMANA